jgi:hypothetical protein
MNGRRSITNFLVSSLNILLHGEIHHFLVNLLARHETNLEIHYRKTIQYKNPLEVHSQRGYLRGFVYASPIGSC